MILNDLECPIHLKVRLVDGTLDVFTFVAGFGFDLTHRCMQKGRRGQLTRCFSAVAELPVIQTVDFGCVHNLHSNRS